MFTGRGWRPTGSQTRYKPVTSALENRRLRGSLDDAEMNVKGCAQQGRGKHAEERLPASARSIRCNGLWLKPFPQCQPSRAGALAVDDGVNGPLQLVGGIRCEIPHPHVQVNGQISVLRLPELHVSEALSCNRSQNRFQVERRRTGRLRDRRAGRLDGRAVGGGWTWTGGS